MASDARAGRVLRPRSRSGFVFQALSIAAFVVLGRRAWGMSLCLALWAVIVGLISVILLLPVTLAGLGLARRFAGGGADALGQAQAAALALVFQPAGADGCSAPASAWSVDLAGRDKNLKLFPVPRHGDDQRCPAFKGDDRRCRQAVDAELVPKSDQPPQHAEGHPAADFGFGHALEEFLLTEGEDRERHRARDRR